MVRKSLSYTSDGLLFADPKEPLQIRIPSGIKRRFKAAAAMRGIEPNELFVEVWDHYERTKDDVVLREDR